VENSPEAVVNSAEAVVNSAEVVVNSEEGEEDAEVEAAECAKTTRGKKRAQPQPERTKILPQTKKSSN
jgi:hypothetical protein